MYLMCSLVQRLKDRDGVADEGSSAASDEEVGEDTSPVDKVEGTLVTMAMAKTWVQRVTKVCPQLLASDWLLPTYSL